MRTSHYALALVFACFSTVDAISLQQEQGMDATWLVQTDLAREACKAKTTEFIKKLSADEGGAQNLASTKLYDVQDAWDLKHPDGDRYDDQVE